MLKSLNLSAFNRSGYGDVKVDKVKVNRPCRNTEQKVDSSCKIFGFGGEKIELIVIYVIT